jgi:hypothetical protein F3_00887
MEIENVLEVEFKEIWDDNFAWRITKQNEDILERGRFGDYDLGVNSTYYPDFSTGVNILYIRGTNEDSDGRINICTTERKEIIEKKVKAINEKYGIIKKWRAIRRERYYYINSMLQIDKDLDYRTIDDDTRYINNNYFKTEELAEEFRDKLIEVLKDNK